MNIYFATWLHDKPTLDKVRGLNVLTSYHSVQGHGKENADALFKEFCLSGKEQNKKSSKE
jgi:hypothetical protein